MSVDVPSKRDDRRALVREMVASYAVRSQTELVDLLAQHGLEVTQATVSRDLEELQIAKVRGADGSTTYTLPDDWGLAQALRQFAISVEASGNLAVVKSPPGTAAAVAIAIDNADLSYILATLQGDDTVLVVAAEPMSGRDAADRLLQMRDRRSPPTR